MAKITALHHVRQDLPALLVVRVAKQLFVRHLEYFPQHPLRTSHEAHQPKFLEQSQDLVYALVTSLLCKEQIHHLPHAHTLIHIVAIHMEQLMH